MSGCELYGGGGGEPDGVECQCITYPWRIGMKALQGMTGWPFDWYGTLFSMYQYVIIFLFSCLKDEYVDVDVDVDVDVIKDEYSGLCHRVLVQ